MNELGTPVRPAWRSLLLPVLLTLVLIGAVADAWLTITGVLAPLDRSLTEQLYHLEAGWMTPIMIALTLLGEDPPLDAIALAVAYLAYRLRRRLLAGAMIGVAVAARVLALAMKYIVHQPRPFLHAPPHPLSLLHGYGYPSGHAFLSMAILGFSALALSTLLIAPAARWITCTVCLLLILGIGWSRVYLGFHWVNDVVGGYLDGAAVGLAGWAIQDRVQVSKSVTA